MGGYRHPFPTERNYVKSYILWDHDGVLVDTEPWYFEATRQTIEPLGVARCQNERPSMCSTGSDSKSMPSRHAML